MKFKDLKPVKFVLAHKKPFIIGGIVTVVAIAVAIPIAASSRTVEGDFTYAFNDYKNYKQADSSIIVEGNFKTGTVTEVVDEVDAFISNTNLSVTYSVDIAEAGEYSIYLNNHLLGSGFKDSEFIVDVDGTAALERGKIRANFKNASEDFKLDSYGNEICPSQETITVWDYQGIYDYQYTSPLPYSFSLTAGAHEITLNQIAGEEIALGNISLRKLTEIKSYEEYHKAYETANAGYRLDAIEGEHFSYKNDTSPIPSNSPDINVTPYKTIEAMLNTLANFSLSNQIISYDFNVEVAGNYVINLNANINNSNHTTFATFFIDGVVPFGELLHYPLSPTKGYQEIVLQNANKQIFNIYLTEGKHTLSIKIDVSLYKDVINVLDNAVDRLNAIYLSLKRIAGTAGNNKQWDPNTDFPGISEEINDIYNQINATTPIIRKINGSKANFQALIYIRSALSSIKGVLSNPKTIPNKYGKFSEGSGSIIENLANASSDLSVSPLEIDRIIIGAGKDYKLKGKKNGFNSFIEKVKKFFISFVYDYSGKSTKGKTLEIWVARSRQYVDLMQELIDGSDFKEKTGYNVKFVILSDESKLILSNAARISPDGVMGISNWLPYEMGIRDLTVDLTQFDDYGEVIDRFSEGAMISLIADEKGLALPETQDFYVMYYRKDISEKYGFTPPDTWTDLVGLLPKMQRNGFNFYIPLSTSTSAKSIMTTAPFIYQYGGTLFSDDGLKTTIDDENSINGIKMMTELFTLYGLESQVANFFNSFRNGSLPIGVSTFDTYVKLTLSAPELTGKWDIMLAPGVKQGEDVVRWQTGSAQSMCLINKNKAKNNAGWELLKWWSSADTQREFGKRLSLQYGKGYIWNTANLEAFKDNIIFTEKEKAVILEQWKHMREIPRVPGWYMLERELSNSWNNIVLNGQNTRATIENAVDLINKELIRKLTEFGYLDNMGKVIKPYHVTTLEMIQELKKKGK